MNKYLNIHLLPMFQRKIAYGSNGFPWTIGRQDISYEKGICPVAERMNDSDFFGLEFCMHEYDNNDIDLIIDAIHKVWKNLKDLH